MAVGADAPMETTLVPAGPVPEPSDGQVCVHVAKLVVTANTLTYAVAGNLLNAVPPWFVLYWYSFTQYTGGMKMTSSPTPTW